MEAACIVRAPGARHSAQRKEAIVIALLALLAVAAAPQPSAEATKAFDDYVAQAEERIRRESSAEAFNNVGDRDELALDRGKVVVEARGPTNGQQARGAVDVSGGMIHDWSAEIVIPGVTNDDVLATVQDYEHTARYYAPEVMSSRLIARDGDHFRIALRMRERRVVTVVMDAEFEVQYGRLDAKNAWSFSRSTQITEIADAGGLRERALSDEENHGYLWRLNSYWRFIQVRDGVVAQCEAISLTRDVPTGLGWLVGRFVREIPRESLEATLGATREAVVDRARAGHSTPAEHR
jgi:hypothetical protein